MKKTDLALNVQNYILNIRAAGIIIHNRKIREEIGKDIEITGYISTIENFFEMKGSKYHEIMFAHKMDFSNKEDNQIEHTIKNIEGKDYLQYEWIDISKIDDYPILPKNKKYIKRKCISII